MRRVPHSRPLRLGLVVGALLLIAGIAKSAMPNLVRIPIVRAHGKGDPQEAALFSHWRHDQYACYACHPTIFPQALVGFTHDEMDKGQYCAACHNGRVAWSADDRECETCHRP